MATSRKKKIKTERINEQLRLELLKLKSPESEPVITDSANEKIKDGEKYVFDKQLGGWFKVVDPFSAVYTKRRPDR
tara:strand:+ start:3056 stop:3283 length:228 start_codon:yes stop_codon:yes gene_type:complete